MKKTTALTGMLVAGLLSAPSSSPGLERRIQNDHTNRESHSTHHLSSDLAYTETIRRTRLLSQAYARPTLLVVKDERRAYLFTRGEIDTSFAIALGTSPVGDKLYEGDNRTPEGVYTITWKRDGTPGNTTKYDLAFLLDYPQPADWEEFITARKEGRIPRGVKSPGGFIEIHAGFDFFDWTEGCISLQKAGMEYLMKKGMGKGNHVGVVGYIPDSMNLEEK